MDALHVHDNTRKKNTNSRIHFRSKPIRIFYFLDPLCSICWLTDAHIKKLTIEYGAYFNIRPIINHPFIVHSKKSHQCATHLRLNRWDKYYLSLSIKAATLQGNRAGRIFLRIIQHAIFLYYDRFQPTKNHKMIHAIINRAAKKSNLDLKVFYDDLFSESVDKAYQSDIQLINEMDVSQFPTLIFFNEKVDDYGVKVSGVQNYETYTYLIKDMLHHELPLKNKPSLEETLAYYKIFKTEDIAMIYDWTYKEAEKQLRQLQLMQIVKKVDVNGFRLWEYSG